MTMVANQDFQYDVFLSHSAKDKAVVRSLAERLRADGLKVWFDEWVLKPGDSIPAKIEEGLEHSRVLVLCMSANAFGSDWAQLESGTFRFRDPMNQERRFIPVRLDDSPIKGSLAQFLYVDWCSADGEQEYAKLLETCLTQTDQGGPMRGHPPRVSEETVVELETAAFINSYAFSRDRKQVLTGDVDYNLRVWNLESGRCVQKLLGHSGDTRCVLWDKGERHALSGSADGTVRFWDLKTGRWLRKFVHADSAVSSVAWGANYRHAFSGSEDGFVHLWEVETGQELRSFKCDSPIRSLGVSRDETRIVTACDNGGLHMWSAKWWGGRVLSFDGHKGPVLSIGWSADDQYVVSASADMTVRIWDAKSGRCIRVLEGHSAPINSVGWSADNRHIVSGSEDETVRVWEAETGRRICVLDGHTRPVRNVAWSAERKSLLSGDDTGAVRVVQLTEDKNETQRPRTTLAKPRQLSNEVQYTNAKVLLVGDSGVGKTALSNYLAHGVKVEEDKPLPSTDGAWATHWPLKHDIKKAGVEREIWLWDFAGQVDYRLVHQLFIDETAAAVLVFNPQNENPFEGLGHWDRDLRKGARKPLAKLLAAARVDRGGLVVSAASMKKFMMERGFLDPLHVTSAKTGEGCDQLREAIVQAIDWKSIPETTSPALYRRLKQEILSLRDSGLVLIRLAELKQRMEMTMRRENFELAELEAVVGLLAGPGIIQRLDFGGFILLRPEVLSRYAAAVVRKARKHPQELGCIREDELLAGDLDYQDFKRLPGDDEAVVLRTLLETLVSRAWCLRQPCDGSAVLTFPSYFRRERKEQPSHPSVLVTYRFDGPADEIYATLVVRLHHTVAFQSTELWKAAADFKTQTGAKLGFTIMREGEGPSLLEVYFAPEVDGNSKVVFLRYVHDHLMQHGQNVVRLRRYFCGNKKCDSQGKPFADQAMIDKALAPGGKGKVFCSDCGKPILLRDTIEEKFESVGVQIEARMMEKEARTVIDNESRELILVGHAYSIVAEAGQIYRGYTNSDHGIDGEIEFKDKQGRASGKRIYVQLKSGDSYLRKRRRQGEEAFQRVFQINHSRWIDYWQQQAYPVMLVIRTSDGEIRWMDVSAYLKNQSAAGKTVRQIVFEGERFDVMSVRRWRERVLGNCE